MNVFLLIILFMVAFALQYLFTFLQMRNFTKAYRACRLQGYRAAIGKFSGKIHAGAIVMFGINDEGTIMNGTALQGVTVLARFKDFNHFNGINIENVSKCEPEGVYLSYSLKKAISDAELNYKTIMKGEEVPVPPSPFQKAGNMIVEGGKKIGRMFSQV